MEMMPGIFSILPKHERRRIRKNDVIGKSPELPNDNFVKGRKPRIEGNVLRVCTYAMKKRVTPTPLGASI